MVDVRATSEFGISLTPLFTLFSSVSKSSVSPMNTLILVDLQNDFLPGGALAIPGGDEVIPAANRLMIEFDLIVATQDWHPPDHGSFASNHPGRAVFETIDLHGLPQTLWPVHCVQETHGAAFAATLDTTRIEKIFQKGTRPEIDSYSGFHDNGRRNSTGMAGWLLVTACHRQFMDRAIRYRPSL